MHTEGESGSKTEGVADRAQSDDVQKWADDDRGWVRFFVMIFGDRAMFRRFMVALLLVLVFALCAGWLWGAASASAAAVGAAVLRWVGKRLGG
ncbi:hypothetical protein [Umezawaea tangerina]|uniref:Uncharacterized protein n=1 Tax=Umezawaea tangerina TaxID=84725 RepID=A0A2T0TJR9_9PSEU|nr:hypothetical protein [Umezawaea tangerina]PRY45851.1 hypothetical protein CLV43_101111 [Umezawaea tangerina]